ncbi:hypothetical protein IFR04_007234 [Cadophora malorum]|uniref:Uncharacterized protein n=1 Tax=Cadophora malorum TaxID=108018 RepID=A0A8H7W8W1_9HELO|nr:hypothetical protein IFR04_007234 [Cadophora malorum]
MTSSSSSLVPPTALTISSQSFSTALPTLTADPRSGFSTGEKAGIGIGASVGALFVISLVFLAYRFGKRIRKEGVMLDREEMGEKRIKKPDMQIYVPLTVDEKRELDRRRRASELEGGGMAVEMDGGERAELEARRRMARDLHELGS